MLSIGEFSRISNVTTKTLRYYDEIGLLKPADVSGETGYRYYDVAQLRSVLLISRLKLYGCTLVEIAQVLSRGEDEALLSLLREKRRALQQKQEEYRFLLGQISLDTDNLERGISIMSYLENTPVKLIETESQNVLFIRKRMNVQDTGRTIMQLFEAIGAQKLTPLGPPLAIFHDTEYNPENYDMEVAVPVKEAVKGTRALPGCLCVTATLQGPYTELPSVYAKLNQWMEAEGYRLAGPGFEVYQTDPGQTKPEEHVTDVYFPVRK